MSEAATFGSFPRDDVVGSSLERTARLRLTRDEGDVVTVAVGPGMAVERGFLGRRTHHGFECGVLATGAVVVE